MADNEYQFRSHDFDGFRLIHSTLPRLINDSQLSVVAWQFLEHYETADPYAVLSDYTHVAQLSETAVGVIGALIEKSFADPRFLGAV